MRLSSFLAGLLPIILLATAVSATQPHLLPATGVDGLSYDVDFFPGVSHDEGVAAPESLLGWPVGEKFSSPVQITDCILAWAAASPRITVTEYARSHEDRPLHYVMITSPENHAKLEEIQAGIQRLADPVDLDEAEATRLIDSLPAVAWFAYSIHGNETSGSDAALAVIWHLASAQDDETKAMLDDLVVIIDPLMNPDGRNRFFEQTTGTTGRNPSVDDQSLVHRGAWPSGRVNHYLFDLNRDWAYGVHPETRGRMRVMGSWYPQLVVDGHEMGSQDTYLMSPAREPINEHYPESQHRWGAIFARDQGAAFDEHGWPYYTGEWLDEYYPGYTSWGALRGGFYILYEQARIAVDAVRRPGGDLVTHRESVHHQVTSTMANLRTFHAHRDGMMRDFLAMRREAIATDGPYARRSWVVMDDRNQARVQALVDLLELHGIRYGFSEGEKTIRDAVDVFGRTHDKLTIPHRSLIIPGRQPEARLAAALLEFDPRMKDETLREERKELLRRGRSRMYDVTAWTPLMMFDLEAYEVPGDFDDLPESLTIDIESRHHDTGNLVAFAFDGRDDRTVTVAARLMERGVEVACADRAFSIGDDDLGRGTVVVTRNANRRFAGDWIDEVRQAGEAVGLDAAVLRSGLGEGDVPDLGGRHFKRLEPPRIAVLTRGGTSILDYGAIWHVLDARLGIRHSHLDETALGRADLRRYNVLILPDRWGAPLPASLLPLLADWVADGGTLVAVGASAEQIVGAGNLSGTSLLPDALDDLDRYERAILREWLAGEGDGVDPAAVWAHRAPTSVDLPVPFESTAGKPESLKKQDEWLRLFTPQGALLAGRIDDEHWLTAGCGSMLPLLYGDSVGSTPVLMAADGVAAPVRFGVFRPGDEGKKVDDKQAFARVGWSPLPDGQQLVLRLSGLMWPEATQRLASSAYVTVEGRGRGQVILFAAPPAFRGATLGTIRLLANAVICGPGMGARPTIRP